MPIVLVRISVGIEDDDDLIAVLILTRDQPYRPPANHEAAVCS
jgi:hypothetical protein